MGQEQQEQYVINSSFPIENIESLDLHQIAQKGDTATFINWLGCLGKEEDGDQKIESILLKKDETGDTVYHAAVQSGSWSLFDALLFMTDAGERALRIKNSKNQTVLEAILEHCPNRKNYQAIAVKILQLYISVGAIGELKAALKQHPQLINYENEQGISALGFAVKSRFVRSVSVLLEVIDPVEAALQAVIHQACQFNTPREALKDCLEQFVNDVNSEKSPRAFLQTTAYRHVFAPAGLAALGVLFKELSLAEAGSLIEKGYGGNLVQVEARGAMEVVLPATLQKVLAQAADQCARVNQTVREAKNQKLTEKEAENPQALRQLQYWQDECVEEKEKSDFILHWIFSRFYELVMREPQLVLKEEVRLLIIEAFKELLDPKFDYLNYQQGLAVNLVSFLLNSEDREQQNALALIIAQSPQLEACSTDDLDQLVETAFEFRAWETYRTMLGRWAISKDTSQHLFNAGLLLYGDNDSQIKNQAKNLIADLLLNFVRRSLWGLLVNCICQEKGAFVAENGWSFLFELLKNENFIVLGSILEKKEIPATALLPYINGKAENAGSPLHFALACYFKSAQENKANWLGVITRLLRRGANKDLNLSTESSAEASGQRGAENLEQATAKLDLRSPAAIVESSQDQELKQIFETPSLKRKAAELEGADISALESIKAELKKLDGYSQIKDALIRNESLFKKIGEEESEHLQEVVDIIKGKHFASSAVEKELIGLVDVAQLVSIKNARVQAAGAAKDFLWMSFLPMSFNDFMAALNANELEREDFRGIAKKLSDGCKSVEDEKKREEMQLKLQTLVISCMITEEDSSLVKEMIKIYEDVVFVDDSDGDSLLHIAVAKYMEDVADLILQIYKNKLKGEDFFKRLDQFNHRGHSALHVAVSSLDEVYSECRDEKARRQVDLSVLELLLLRGAGRSLDPEIRTALVGKARELDPAVEGLFAEYLLLYFEEDKGMEDRAPVTFQVLSEHMQGQPVDLGAPRPDLKRKAETLEAADIEAFEKIRQSLEDESGYANIHTILVAEQELLQKINRIDNGIFKKIIEVIKAKNFMYESEKKLLGLIQPVHSSERRSLFEFLEGWNMDQTGGLFQHCLVMSIDDFKAAFSRVSLADQSVEKIVGELYGEYDSTKDKDKKGTVGLKLFFIVENCLKRMEGASKVKKILKSYPGIASIMDDQDNTVLHLAVVENLSDVVVCILKIYQKDLSPEESLELLDHRDLLDRSALRLAIENLESLAADSAEKGEIKIGFKILDSLLENGAGAHLEPKEKEELMQRACELNPAYRKLFEEYSSVTRENVFPREPSSPRAASYGKIGSMLGLDRELAQKFETEFENLNATELEKLLEQNPALANHRHSKLGCTAVYFIIQKVLKLEARAVNIAAEDRPLADKNLNKCFEVVEILLKHGAAWEESREQVGLIQKVTTHADIQCPRSARAVLELFEKLGKLSDFQRACLQVYLGEWDMEQAQKLNFDLKQKDRLGCCLIDYAASGDRLDLLERLLEQEKIDWNDCAPPVFVMFAAYNQARRVLLRFAAELTQGALDCILKSGLGNGQKELEKQLRGQWETGLKEAWNQCGKEPRGEQILKLMNRYGFKTLFEQGGVEDGFIGLLNLALEAHGVKADPALETVLQQVGTWLLPKVELETFEIKTLLQNVRRQLQSYYQFTDNIKNAFPQAADVWEILSSCMDALDFDVSATEPASLRY